MAIRTHAAARHRGSVPRLMAGRRVRIAAIVTLGVVVITGALMPVINGQLARLVIRRVAAQMTVPGGAAPQITLGGGWIVPQVLAGRLTEIRATLPDARMGDVQHASLSVTLRGVSQGGGTDHADSIEVAARLPFASLPAQPGQPRASLARAADGSLAVTVPSNPRLAADQITKVFVKLELAGNTITAVPQGMLLFGHLLPASKASSVTGGSHVTHLPALPTGLAYRSVTPESDGLHVALSGVATTPLSGLPTSVGGRAVSYTSSNGLLGISTSISVLVASVPLTIWVQPTLTAGTLTMVPRSVQLAGKNRPTSDPLAKIVLSQISQSQLTRQLPALPAGVRYQSASVDSAGVHVAVGGVTVQPFSSLPSTTPGAVFGAHDGLLVTTVKGEPANTRPTTILMLARPGIEGGALVIQPEKFVILGTAFSPGDVMSQVKIPGTRYSLPALPAHMTYTGIDVEPGGLLVTVAGQNVTLTKNVFGGLSWDRRDWRWVGYHREARRAEHRTPGCSSADAAEESTWICDTAPTPTRRRGWPTPGR